MESRRYQSRRVHHNLSEALKCLISDAIKTRGAGTKRDNRHTLELRELARPRDGANVALSPNPRLVMSLDLGDEEVGLLRAEA